jgi:low affinity Fe/Cu permease
MAKRKRSKLGESFHRLAFFVSAKLGTPAAFVAAVLVVVAWATTGPFFGFGDTWQLVINTSTTIVTFLMVFLIQATQNRESRAVQLKLDELIRATKARNEFADLEEADDEELEDLQRDFHSLRERYMRRQKRLGSGRKRGRLAKKARAVDKPAADAAH